MRPLYVPVRLAAALMALAAAATGCVNVGDDGGRTGPSHSAGRRGGGEAPDGVPGVSGAEGGRAGDGDSAHGHGRKAKADESESAAPSGSAGADGTTAAPTGPAQRRGRSPRAGDPAPSQPQPTPPRTAEPTTTPPPATPDPPTTPPTPPTAEPSSSAHAEAGPQLVRREPAPAAGVPA
ncbi:hypothetical protein [Streptomyces sp. V3I7]|uniref:hypothetical protein n=1 Tax=Streptomyces sp. V3I7 TaxID=3042278 RepID=UPI00277E8772|nr:hypothetical protein [Streptomyces sp. V3I7]MDQ0991742.1 hypothetical protein [Streptomyces sp. V3I7]